MERLKTLTRFDGQNLIFKLGIAAFFIFVCLPFILGILWLFWKFVVFVVKFFDTVINAMALFLTSYPFVVGGALLGGIFLIVTTNIVTDLYRTSTTLKQSHSELPFKQHRVWVWLNECFGKETSESIPERSARFLEESLELVQTLGFSKEGAHAMVEYVYSRPVGETYQEIAGSTVTLLALATAVNVDVEKVLEDEIERIESMVEKIREKQARKPVII